jgi:hypothetical protein
MRNSLSLQSLLGGLAVLMLFTPAGAETIYKWVDSSGQSHFSDVPRDGVAEIFGAAPQVYSPSSPSLIGVSRSLTTSAGADQSADAAEIVYTQFAISSPTAEETIWNTGGTISVSLQLLPSLTAGHTVRVLLDGEQKQQLGPGVTNTQLTGIVRGAHQIEAQIVAPDRKLVKAATPVTFFYHQTSTNRRPASGPRANP